MSGKCRKNSHLISYVQYSRSKYWPTCWCTCRTRLWECALVYDFFGLFDVCFFLLYIQSRLGVAFLPSFLHHMPLSKRAGRWEIRKDYWDFLSYICSPPNHVMIFCRFGEGREKKKWFVLLQHYHWTWETMSWDSALLTRKVAPCRVAPREEEVEKQRCHHIGRGFCAQEGDTGETKWMSRMWNLSHSRN